MNETIPDLRAVPRAAKVIEAARTTVNASASGMTPKAADAGRSATTTRLPSLASTSTPRSEPVDRSWLVAVLVIGTIAIVVLMLVIIAVHAGLGPFDWIGPNAVLGVW